MKEHLHLPSLTDSIVLRHKPQVYKPRNRELKTIISSGSLTITKVRTAKGKLAYKFTARTKKYAYLEQLKELKQGIDAELEKYLK